MSQSSEKRIRVSDATRSKINDELVEPSYISDITNLLKGKTCWRITGQTFETVSKVFVALGSIISFAAGVYGEPTLSFVSGAISTFSLATLQFASFSYKENKKQATELNVLLKTLELDAIPVNERTADDSTGPTFRQSVQSTYSPNRANLERQNTVPNIQYISYTDHVKYAEQMERICALGSAENQSLKNEVILLQKQLEEITKSNENEVKFHSETDEKTVEV